MGALYTPELRDDVWTLQHLKRGDQRAWRLAFTELWALAARVVSRRVFSEAAASDLCQETLTVVASQINTFSDERHIKAMTAVIAQRKAAHFLRDETAGRRDRRCEVGLDSAAEVAAAALSINAASDLEQFLANLEPIDRALVEGHFLEGCTSQELAARHSLNPNTVRGRIKRSIDAMKAACRSIPGSDGTNAP